MSLRLGLAVAALASAVAVSPAAAQVTGYAGPPYSYGSGAYDAGDENYGPRLRRSSAFDQVRTELEGAGFTRIIYRTEREDHYGSPVYYLTACRRGIRYRLHVTADCQIEFKRRAGYCEDHYY